MHAIINFPILFIKASKSYFKFGVIVQQNILGTDSNFIYMVEKKILQFHTSFNNLLPSGKVTFALESKFFCAFFIQNSRSVKMNLMCCNNLFVFEAHTNFFVLE